MIALVVGLVLIVFAVYSVLPIEGWGLQWWDEVLEVLKGGVPLAAVFIGLIAVLIGVADIRDRIEAKKEEEEEARETVSEDAAKEQSEPTDSESKDS